MIRPSCVINRRGSASVVVCRDCGYVQICPGVPAAAGFPCQPRCRCAAITAARRHRSRGAARRATRRASATWAAARSASSARSASASRELRVGRLDRDVVERKGAAARVMDAFADGDDSTCSSAPRWWPRVSTCPQVTLVGIVSADIALNLPDERAAERTYQLLAQAVGRAGGASGPGRAIIQTYSPITRLSAPWPTGRGRVLRRRAGVAPAFRLAAVRAARSS